MARATIDRKVKPGTKIEALTQTLTVTKVLKHAYKVNAADGTSRPDVWSFNVHVTAAGSFATNQY